MSPDLQSPVSIPQRIMDEVTRYDQTYRHPQLRRLEVSGLYALVPNEPSPGSAPDHWPEDRWPQGSHPGVYLVFDGAMDLCYVGRALMLGRNDYFCEAPDGGCEVRHTTWKSQPRFIATIAVERSFEAGALEEYLIGKLRPRENATAVQDPSTW
jgi:hypothetical protein